MAAFAPLLAAGFDWLEGLLPLLFVFIWIISQVLNFFRRVAAAGQQDEDDDDEEDEGLLELFGSQRNGARRCPGCGHQFVASAAAIAPCPECGRLTLDEMPDDLDLVDDLPVQSDRETIEAEIDAFLRRPRRSPPPLPQAAGLEPRPLRQPADSLAEPVAAMLAAAGSTERANDEISRHIHDVFDKGLGRLPDGTVENPWADLEPVKQGRRPSRLDPIEVDAAAIRATTGNLAALLKNPATIRQAFLLREVLDRPTDRWE
jgi:predicted  nucleic acid-binding Zn-ribbon protein